MADPIKNPKLEGFYNMLKSNPAIEGLPDNYADFEAGLSDAANAEGFYNALKSNPTIEGLPDNFQSFSDGLGLKKKEPSEPVSPVGSGASQPTSKVDPQKEARVVRELTAKAVAVDLNAQRALEGYAARKNKQPERTVPAPLPDKAEQVKELTAKAVGGDQMALAGLEKVQRKEGVMPVSIATRKDEIDAMAKYMGRRTRDVNFEELTATEPGAPRLTSGENQYKLLESDYLDYLDSSNPELGESKRNDANNCLLWHT